MSFIIEPGDNPADPNSISRRRKIAEELMKRGTDTSPVQHWTQGAARIADVLSGIVDERRADKDEAKQQAWESNMLSSAMGGGGAPQASTGSPVAAALSAGGGGDSDYFSRLASKENASGDPTVRNKLSGATGTYQFMPGTWRGLMEKYPNLGLTLDGITDPQQQNVAVRQFTQDNAKTLTGAGIPANPQTLSLAHQQGAGGAVKLLQNPDAPAASIVGVKAVVQNGGRPDMTAGEFAKHVMGYYGMQGGGQPQQPQAPQPTAMGGQTANDGPQPGIPQQPQQTSQSGMVLPQQPGGMMGAAAQASAPAQAVPPQMVAQAQAATQGMSVQQMMQAAQRMSPQGQAVMRMLIQQKVEQAQKQADPVYQSKVRMIPQQEEQLGLQIQEQRAKLGMQPLQEEQLKLAIAEAGEKLKDAPIRREGLALDNDVKRKSLKDKPMSVGINDRLVDPETGREIVPAVPKGREAPTVRQIKQPDGSEVAVQWDDKTGDWVPLKAPEGGNAVKPNGIKLTEGQSKDVGYYNRVEPLLNRMEEQEKSLTSYRGAVAGSVPLVGNALKGEDYRQAEQTGREILAVILRKDTGAAVTPSEMDSYGKMYLAQPGDDPATIQQKAAGRRKAIEGLKMGLGTADILFQQRDALEALKKGSGAPQQEGGWREISPGVRVREVK